ncbi:MAG: hypothetical protein ABIY55_15160, partial [Kofleriaceae bacterium]
MVGGHRRSGTSLRVDRRKGGVMNNGKLETLVIARAFATAEALSAAAFARALRRFAPASLTDSAWGEAIDAVVVGLRARAVIDDRNRLIDRGELARRIGPHGAKRWQQLAERYLPALALEITPDDTARHKRLAGRDEWTAAVVARALGLWATGAPPSLPQLCDALTWRGLGLSGKPRRCPAEVRAHFVQHELAIEPGPPDRLVRLLAAKLVDVPRPELRALRDGLVRNWLTDRAVGRPARRAPDAASPAPAAPPTAQHFAEEVLEIAQTTRDGVFGDRKVFISSVWNALRHHQVWSALTLDDFKARLVSAHRAGALSLVRADLVAAMDPSLVAASETITDGASFHFIVREVRS